MSSPTLWPTIAFDLQPRDDSGTAIAGALGASAASGPIDLIQVFAGATGSTGPPYTPNEFSVVTSVNGFQVLTLASPALVGGTLFINGLAQRKDAYVISGTALAFPAELCLVSGDLITFVYPS